MVVIGYEQPRAEPPRLLPPRPWFHVHHALVRHTVVRIARTKGAVKGRPRCRGGKHRRIAPFAKLGFLRGDVGDEKYRRGREPSLVKEIGSTVITAGGEDRSAVSENNVDGVAKADATSQQADGFGGRRRGAQGNVPIARQETKPFMKIELFGDKQHPQSRQYGVGNIDVRRLARETNVGVESAALSFRALDVEAPAPKLQQLFGDRGAKAGASITTGRAAVLLSERFEDARNGIGFYADARIVHHEADQRGCLIRVNRMRFERHITFVGELDGIRE